MLKRTMLRTDGWPRKANTRFLRRKNKNKQNVRWAFGATIVRTISGLLGKRLFFGQRSLKGRCPVKYRENLCVCPSFCPSLCLSPQLVNHGRALGVWMDRQTDRRTERRTGCIIRSMFFSNAAYLPSYVTHGKLFQL